MCPLADLCLADAHSPIDWQKVAAITAPEVPVQFAIIKITEGVDFKDPTAAIGVAPTLDYPFALDLEENKGLGQAEFLIWVEDFMQTFLGNFTGAEPVVLIYGGLDFLKANLPADHTLGARFPLWIAAPGAASPALPPGWTDWAVWQYDWHATIPGVGAEVDADWIR